MRFSRRCGCGLSHAGKTADISRRHFLASGVAALTTVVSGGYQSVRGQETTQRRIDVHHHISPPTWLDAVKRINKSNPPAANWSIQKTIEDMDRGGVATAITSPTTPQVTDFTVEEATRLARESNEYAKALEAQYPNRFGTFAMLPLPHIDQSLKEIEYAFDTLKVDGVGCMTSYGDKWLGYIEFEPVWAELNRRKATVYTHPTSANCCVNLVRGVDDPYIEFGTDTTRTIFTLIFGGVAQRYPDINWIFSHGGGSLTSFYERFTVQALATPPYRGKFSRDDVEKQIRRFHYDTAAVPNEVTLSALAKMVPTSQIVFGTDFPYRTAADHARGVSAFFKGDDLKAVDRENALRLFPRFRT